jgi:hypothetical protein
MNFFLRLLNESFSDVYDVLFLGYIMLKVKTIVEDEMGKTWRENVLAATWKHHAKTVQVPSSRVQSGSCSARRFRGWAIWWSSLLELTACSVLCRRVPDQTDRITDPSYARIFAIPVISCVPLNLSLDFVQRRWIYLTVFLFRMLECCVYSPSHGSGWSSVLPLHQRVMAAETECSGKSHNRFIR